LRPTETLPPPLLRYGLVDWLRQNLFSSWFNALLTLLVGLIGLAVLIPAANWARTQADWSAVSDNFVLFMKGQYPLSEAWRLWLGLYLLAIVIGLIWGVFVRRVDGILWAIMAAPLLLAGLVLGRGATGWPQLVAIDGVILLAYGLGRLRPAGLRRPAFLLLLLYLPLLVLLVRGFGEDGFLVRVPSNLWGGLLLSLLITIIGILVSFPLGVLLAFGRRSSLPAVRGLSVVYIEVIRGVPLVTLLFLGQVMLPFVLPEGMTVDRVLRAMVVTILFSAAYMAENVRGGLQAIPKGQYEAAYAVGLNGLQTTVHIVLPQALRAIIPVLVGQFIGLFKDTSLVALVGLLDLVGIARGVLANPDYHGRQIEVYAFVALVYWLFSYGMSYASRRLEGNLGVGRR
jgi:general L-amino acid transport system permease protein